MKRSRKKQRQKNIARERIARLWSLAEKWDREGRTVFAQTAVDHAKRISGRTNTPLPRTIRRRVCRGCGSLLNPARNLRVRCDKKYRRIVYACGECEHKTYLPYVRKKPS